MYTAIKTQSVPPSASVILNRLLKKIMNDKLSLSFNVMYVHVVLWIIKIIQLAFKSYNCFCNEFLQRHQ